MSINILQRKRKELRSELAQLEKQIYDLETAYLDETKDFGNIFSGWEISNNAAADKAKSKKATQNEDRHFSLSSITSPASKREEHKRIKPEGSQKEKKSKKLKVDKEAEGEAELE